MVVSCGGGIRTLAIGLRRPWQAVDFDEVVRLFPPPPEYFEGGWYETPEQLERKQLSRLQERARRTNSVPFFRRRWDAAGVSYRDLRSLADLTAFPTYNVDDIRASIKEFPPYGDYQGVSPEQACDEPMRLYMSGGTTGKSRPTLYTAWDRAVGSLLMARYLYMQGVRPGDVVMNSWSYSTHNGASIWDEAAYQWLNCIVITASTGAVTSTVRQLELIKTYGVSSVFTVGDYLLRLVEAAEQGGTDPKDLPFTALPAMNGQELEPILGLPTYDSYGFHEVQVVGVGCPARQGVHIFEDAFVVDIVHPETGEPVPDGELGAICVTELYKTGSPQFRFNTMDLSSIYPGGRTLCECGSWQKRLSGFRGRGDNMVRIRGVNIWPEQILEVAAKVQGLTSDYFVRAVRRESGDNLLVSVVSHDDEARFADLAAELRSRIKSELEVTVETEIVGPGELDGLTEAATSPKPKRFRDDR
jgi:phenylacetate-CoA ligase